MRFVSANRLLKVFLLSFPSTFHFVQQSTIGFKLQSVNARLFESHAGDHKWRCSQIEFPLRTISIWVYTFQSI